MQSSKDKSFADSEAKPPEEVGNSSVLEWAWKDLISDSDDEPVTDLAAGFLQALRRQIKHCQAQSGP